MRIEVILVLLLAACGGGEGEADVQLLETVPEIRRPIDLESETSPDSRTETVDLAVEISQDVAPEIAGPLPCDDYTTCLAEHPDLPEHCNWMADPVCVGCLWPGIMDCVRPVCDFPASEVQCYDACAGSPDLALCVDACDTLPLFHCLLTYYKGGACNEVLAACGAPPRPDLCQACEALHRGCEATGQELRCGACLEGSVAVGGLCKPAVDCGSTDCGPNGVCAPEDGPGACRCEPGWTDGPDGPCSDWALVQNEFIPVVQPGEIASFWQGSGAISVATPCHPVSISHGFAMERYEVTRQEYAACVAAGVCAAPEDCDGNGPAPDLDDPAMADHPMQCLTRFQARTYCAWIHARLPTESEWEYAAVGHNLDCPAGDLFPWQDDQLDGAIANYAEDFNPFQDLAPPFGDQGGPTTPVGFFDGSLRIRAEAGWIGGPETFQTRDNASPFGLYDMAGNVAEWTADTWHPDYNGYPPLNGTAWLEPVTFDGVKKGEGWDSEAGGLTTFYRAPKGPLLTFPTMGFRCATDL